MREVRACLLHSPVIWRSAFRFACAFSSTTQPQASGLFICLWDLSDHTIGVLCRLVQNIEKCVSRGHFIHQRHIQTFCIYQKVTFSARFWQVSKRQLVVLCRMSRIPRHGGWGMVQNWFTVFSNKLDTLYVTCAEAKEQRTLRTGGKAAPETTAHIYRMFAL